MFYTIKETRDALKSGKTTSVQLVKEASETFEKDKSAAIPLNAFIEIYDDILAKAEAANTLQINKQKRIFFIINSSVQEL